MSCPLYGYHAVPVMQILVASGCTDVRGPGMAQYV
jgi:hypothetical protein